jgi:hypothetical protein
VTAMRCRRDWRWAHASNVGHQLGNGPRFVEHSTPSLATIASTVNCQTPRRPECSTVQIGHDSERAATPDAVEGLRRSPETASGGVRRPGTRCPGTDHDSLPAGTHVRGDALSSRGPTACGPTRCCSLTVASSRGHPWTGPSRHGGTTDQQPGRHRSRTLPARRTGAIWSPARPATNRSSTLVDSLQRTRNDLGADDCAEGENDRSSGDHPRWRQRVPKPCVAGSNPAGGTPSASL